MLVRKSVLILLIVWVTTALASNFNGDYEESERDNFSRVRRVVGLQGKVKLCGDRLFQVLFAVCTGRSKRQAEPTAVYPGNLSPFLMSVYRPSIDDDLIITEGNWGLDSPSKDRFQKVNLLRHLNKRSPTPERTIGLAQECCYDACNYDQLKKYC